MDQDSEYSKAPITEAILDIQVQVSEGISPAVLANCQDFVKANYPSKRELKAGFLQLEMGQDLAASSTSHVLGHAFVSEDDKQLFQVRTNGFTANRLAPYTGWNAFCPEAKKLWSIYREVAKPTKLNRIALRYINRIDIPEIGVELKDYFRTSPEISPQLPQSMAGFFMQIVIPLSDVKATVNVTQTIVEPSKEGQVSVILDLDFFRTEQLPSGDSEELWTLFNALREKKNFVFEACITDKTRELIR